MTQYTVKYQAGNYSGTRTVTAEDAEDAIAQVKYWVRRQMTLGMYYDSYEVIDSED